MAPEASWLGSKAADGRTWERPGNGTQTKLLDKDHFMNHTMRMGRGWRGATGVIIALIALLLFAQLSLIHI